jgi:hypothetical protein
MRWDATEVSLLIKIVSRWEGVGSRGSVQLDCAGIITGEFGWCDIIVIIREVAVVVSRCVFRTGTFANVLRRVSKRRLVVIRNWLWGSRASAETRVGNGSVGRRSMGFIVVIIVVVVESSCVVHVVGVIR